VGQPRALQERQAKAGRRITKILTNVNNQIAFHVDFIPGSIAILNYSQFNCYVNVGSSSIPDARAFDAAIAPLSGYAADPVGGQDFGVFIDNSSAPGQVFPLPVTIIASTGQADAQAAISSALSSVGGVLDYAQATGVSTNCPNTSTTNLPLSTLVESQGVFSVGSNALICEAGFYLITYGGLHDNTGLGGGANGYLQLLKNGGVINTVVPELATAGIAQTIAQTIGVRLATNDSLTLQYRNQEGGAVGVAGFIVATRLKI
jgi:hypothetical protein